MPELPEVETMVRGLRGVLPGRRLHRLEIRDPTLLQGCTASSLVRRLRGARVARVNRRGKWVVVELEDNRGLIVIQPRMTGGFWLIEPARPEHIRLAFHLDKPDATVWYCDARRLGKVSWYRDAEDAEIAFGRSQGPDALQIDRQELAGRLARTSRGIKPTLMDQKVLAGIGNIYADETLHRAGLHPERPSSSLSSEEIARLHSAIREVLAKAIELEGSSFDAGYRTVLGLEGGFLAQNSVYGREHQPCPSCAGPIRKIRMAGLIGRPTYYCAVCQVIPTATSRPR